MRFYMFFACSMLCLKKQITVKIKETVVYWILPYNIPLYRKNSKFQWRRRGILIRIYKLNEKKVYRKLGFVCHIDLQTIKASSIKAVSIPSQVACRRALVFVPRKFAPFREAAGIDFTRNIIAKVLINRTIVLEFFAGGGVNRRLHTAY